MTGMGGAMDLVAAEGGTVASFPARLLHGQGWGHKLFWGVALRRPRIHDLDHRAVVALILRGRPGQLKRYRQHRQRFPHRWRSRMSRQVFWGSCKRLVRRRRQQGVSKMTGSRKRVGG
jgi:hypothetical protein